MVKGTQSQEDFEYKIPHAVLKCIWNEIFENDFIRPFESAFEDKTIAIYRLLISGLDPKLWRSEAVKTVNLRVKMARNLAQNQ